MPGERLDQLLGSLDDVLQNLRVKNLQVDGTMTVVSTVTYTGNTTIGDSGSDTLTVVAATTFTSAGSITLNGPIAINNVVTMASLTSTAGSASEFVHRFNFAAGTLAFNPNQTGDYISNHYGPITISENSAATITNAATLKVSGAPVAGTNATITNSYAAWISSGAFRADGFALFSATAASNGARVTIGAATAPTGSGSAYTARLDAPAVTIAFATSPQTGDYTGVSLGQATLTNPSSGTITNAATLKIVGGPVASTNVTITNAISLWVAAGRVQLDQGSGAALALSNASGGLALGSTSVNKFEKILMTAGYSFTPTAATAYTWGLRADAATINFNAGTAQTGDLTSHLLDQLTYNGNASNPGVVTNAATLKIVGAPIQGTNMTLSNTYAFWTATGNVRVDNAGLVIGGQQAGPTANATISVIPSRSGSGAGSASAPVGWFNGFASTWAFTGGTAQTGDIVGANFDQLTLTNATSGTVTNASTVKIVGAPIAGSGMTLTNTYALWVAGGLTRFNGSIFIDNNNHIILNTGGGTKIGTATTQKLGFYNATPIVQPTGIADPTAPGAIYSQAEAQSTRNAVVSIITALESLGLLATV